jgi:transposase
MLEEIPEREEIIERIAALDIGKAELVCCVRVPGEPGKSRRMQEVTTYKTMTRSLLVMTERLRELGVTRVIMEATSEYWKPAFYLLEAAGFETWLVNAKDVKHLPGRPKTDKLDAVWLAKIAERQMIRPSFVPPPPIRMLRDLTRYRFDQVAVRTAGEAAGGETVGGRPDQTLGCGHRHLRGLRSGHDGCVDRRAARPEGAR